MRNRAKNRKQLEKEAARNVAFYAEGGPFASLIGMEGEAEDHGLLGGKPCNCGPVTDLHGKALFIDKSDCFVHSPETALHNKTLDSLIDRAEEE